MRHQGRTALVTGASGGLGRAQSAALAREGATVVMLDLRDDGALDAVRAAAPGARIEAVTCDLADLRAAQARVREVAEGLGGIDVLVNNAAVNPLASIEACDLDAFERTQAINVSAAYALVQAVAPGMRAQGWGSIVNLSSITVNGGWSDFSAYVTSKAALVGLTRSLARELGPDGIRVNAVSPGAIPTPLETEVWGDRIESYERFLLEHQSLKFRGSPRGRGRGHPLPHQRRRALRHGPEPHRRRRLVDALTAPPGPADRASEVCPRARRPSVGRAPAAGGGRARRPIFGGRDDGPGPFPAAPRPPSRGLPLVRPPPRSASAPTAPPMAIRAVTGAPPRERHPRRTGQMTTGVDN